MTAFTLPLAVNKEDGKPRRVGFEIEYSGLSIEASAKLLQSLFGGTIKRKNAFVLELNNTGLGDFSVEIDTTLLADETYQGYLAELGIDLSQHPGLKKSLDSVLKRMTQNVVPCEIVMPPIPLPDLSPAEQVVDALRQECAAGTKASLLNAFGLHINIDLAATHAEYLLNHIRAAALLFDWLCAETGVDFSRRALAYIQHYPRDYEQLILSRDYQPTRDRLIDDYLDLVGSRDYALDMMPAFAHFDRDRVMAGAKAPTLIKARPAFHYRLPNSRVNEPDWSVADEWRYWVKLEQVAADRHVLEALAASRQDYMQRPLATRGAWTDRVNEILNQ